MSASLRFRSNESELAGQRFSHPVQDRPYLFPQPSLKKTSHVFLLLSLRSVKRSQRQAHGKGIRQPLPSALFYSCSQQAPNEAAPKQKTVRCQSSKNFRSCFSRYRHTTTKQAVANRKRRLPLLRCKHHQAHPHNMRCRQTRSVTSVCRFDPGRWRCSTV